jgi:hypothetical protein
MRRNSSGGKLISAARTPGLQECDWFEQNHDLIFGWILFRADPWDRILPFSFDLMRPVALRGAIGV